MKTSWLFIVTSSAILTLWSGLGYSLETTPPTVLDFEYATPRTKLGHTPGFRLETDAECAAWCKVHDECCPPEIAEKYYGVATKPADVVYLRGEVAGVMARVGARVAAIDELSERLVRLEFEFIGTPGAEPAPRGAKRPPAEEPPALLDSPVGVWCVKTWGAPSALKETKSRSKAVWKPDGLVVRLTRAEAHTGCRCPKGSKCKCTSLEYTRQTLTIQWK